MDFPFMKEALSQLFSKSSCAMYPSVPSEAAPGYRGRIVYTRTRCISCACAKKVCSGRRHHPHSGASGGRTGQDNPDL